MLLCITGLALFAGLGATMTTESRVYEPHFPVLAMSHMDHEGIRGSLIQMLPFGEESMRHIPILLVNYGTTRYVGKEFIPDVIASMACTCTQVYEWYYIRIRHRLAFFAGLPWHS